MTEPRADERHDGEVENELTVAVDGGAKDPVATDAADPVVVEPAPPPDKPGLGALARTMRRRTTDLIAIAIVVAAGLAFGRQALQWWNTDAEDLSPNLANAIGTADLPWNEPGHPVDVEFDGSDVVLRRERLEGDANDAIAHLVERCTVVLEAAATHADARPRVAITEPESRLLEATAGLEPVRSDEGRWSIYVTPIPQPTAFGIVEASDPSDECAACGSRRIVCWGVLMGGEHNGWTAFWFERRPGDAAGSDDRPGVVVALPRGARRTLSLRDPGGEGVVAFRGAGDLLEWRDFFEGSLNGSGRRMREWMTGDGSVMARFRSETGHTIDVRIVDRGTELTGLMTIGGPRDGDDPE